MAVKWKETLAAKGPKAIGMFGSGQWTIWEGYAAAKLMKAGFRSNNLDPNARHCMASAVTGFMRTFGIDEPMGCYDDFEAADAFVLWGANMAEMHPILWTRLADRRLGHPHVKVAVHVDVPRIRSMDLADIPIVFWPGTDLAIMNYIARRIRTIETGRVNEAFVGTHAKFMKGTDRHRLWPPSRASARDGSRGGRDGGRDGGDGLRGVPPAGFGYTLRTRLRTFGSSPTSSRNWRKSTPILPKR